MRYVLAAFVAISFTIAAACSSSQRVPDTSSDTRIRLLEARVKELREDNTKLLRELDQRDRAIDEALTILHEQQ